MLDIYTDFAMNEAAVPVIPGRKSSSERFAGADATTSIEAMMGDGQGVAGRHIAQSRPEISPKAFEIRYLDQAARCNIVGRHRGDFRHALSAPSLWFMATIRD